MHRHHPLIDRDGDRADFWTMGGGRIFVTVAAKDKTVTAGPFTRDQLTEAREAIAPAGNSTGPHVHHEAPNRDDYPRGGLLQTIPALAAFNTERRARAERERLGRIVQAVADGDGHTTQVYGVKIAPCDTYGRTRDEVAASVNAARAEDRRTLAEAERDELREKLTAAERDRAAADAAVEQMARDIDTICTQRNTARADRDKAERERDSAREDRQELQERLAIQQKMAAQPRPLTPDAITDEMVERGFKRLAQLDNSGISLRSTWAARQVLETVLIPGRPGGAEGWDEELGEMPAAQDLTPEQRTRLADALAERDHALGVRVATEDGAR